MKTLLRKTSSGLFFQAPDQWTKDPAEALNFQSIDRALSFVQTYRLEEEVELAFAFQDLASVTRVPLEQIMVAYSEE